ncbi:uncharacterized protein ARMOST_17979 [Armillaria ostoyae]|uniref:Uncharacterized protein n=1 Tax=Armillaria ostoyae TaxID=47428 RepID=A0A284S0L0_ARMOS|nr:uncharacterized protein ARMOST_17979 [Armillaria ostoyae]
MSRQRTRGNVALARILRHCSRWTALVLCRDMAMIKECDTGNFDNPSFPICSLKLKKKNMTRFYGDWCTEYGVREPAFRRDGWCEEGEGEEGYVSESIGWTSGEEDKRHLKEYRADVVLAVFRTRILMPNGTS